MTPIKAADLRKDLQMTLDPIKEKRPKDGRWIYVKRSGQLDLYARPTGWRLVVECIKRIYCALRSINPYGELDSRITSLSAKVNDYLRAEKDMKALNEFLITYNPALNELFTAQQKFAAARKTAAPDYSKFKALRDLCVLDKHGAVLMRKVYYSFENTSDNKTVVFNFLGQRFPVEPRSHKEFQISPNYYSCLQIDVSVEDDAGTVTLPNVPAAFKNGNVEIRYPAAFDAYATIESEFCAELGASQHLCVSYDNNEGLKHVITDEGPRRISLKNNSESTVEVWVKIKGAKDTYDVSSLILTPHEGLDKSFDHFIDWIEEQFPEKKSERWIADALKKEASLTFEVELTETKH